MHFDWRRYADYGDLESEIIKETYQGANMIKRINREDFDAVFSIMEQSFPLDEYRTYEEQKELFAIPEYAIYGLYAEDESLIKGFAAVWEFENVVFLEHLAVNPACRNGGLGAKMLQGLKEEFGKPICLEVELPEDELTRRRIGFYERNGFVLNPYDYIQPPLSKGRKAIPLMIMTSEKGLSQEEFFEVRDLLYKKVYFVVNAAS